MTYPEKETSQAALLALGGQLQQMTQTRTDRSQPVPPVVTQVVLAAFVEGNLPRGGFAQLLFNAGGNYLAEIAQMLQSFNAVKTLEFYEHAIRLCLADKPDYQRFLSSDFVSDSALKNALQGVSLDYFASDLSFAQEAAALLQPACQQAELWLAANVPSH